MTLLRRIIGAIVLVAAATVLGMILLPAGRTGPTKSLAADYKVPSGAGEAAARAADCGACHTAPGGKPFAGGLGIASPWGTIYASNITPDKATGIGAYTLDEFRAVLYDGVRRDGKQLYPAMPYTSYRKLTEEDVRALYAFFTTDVAPVANTPPPTSLRFPYNLRWGVRAWNWLALSTAGFTPHMGDAVLDRGAYLVEGPGHCGACHTPRNALFMEKGSVSTSADFLTGFTLGLWPTPDLRARNSSTQQWSREEIAAYLKRGRNATDGAAGEMALAVEHSLQHLPASDIDAIAAYLKAIGQPREGVAVRSPPTATAAKLTEASAQMELGGRLYLDNCNACHFTDGKGASGVFPRLDRNSLVVAADPRGLIAVILGGAQMPSTAERPERLAMPGFGWRLSDDDVAALATFVRQGWSNTAGAVSAADVKAVRAALPR